MYVVTGQRIASKGSRLLIGLARLPLLTVVVMTLAAAAAMKHFLVLNVLICRQIQRQQPACQLRLIFSLLLLDVYGPALPILGDIINPEISRSPTN